MSEWRGSEPAVAQVAAGGFSLQPVPIASRPPRSHFNFTLSPGSTAKDEVVLSNLSATAKTFTIYAADAYNLKNGGFALRLANQPKHDVGAWIKLPVTSYVVPPDFQATIPFTISVPANASPGDHAGGIVAMLVTPVRTTGGSRIEIKEAVGTRVYVRVNGPLHPGMRLERLSVVRSRSFWSLWKGGGSARVSFEVANTGNVQLTGSAFVRATTPLGGTVRSFAPVAISALLPGASTRISLPDWQPLPFVGPVVRLTAEVRAGGLEARSATSFTEVPWGLVGTLALVLLASAGWSGWRWHKRRKARSGRSGQQAEPVPGDKPAEQASSQVSEQG